MSMESLKAPQQFDVEASNLTQAWKLWKEDFQLYINLVMGDNDDMTKVKMLLYLVGNKGRELYQSIKPASEKLSSALKAFEDHCNPPRN